MISNRINGLHASNFPLSVLFDDLVLAPGV